jgi:phosphatidate cytidylyltransferase
MKTRIISGIIIAAIFAVFMFFAHIPFVLNAAIALLSAAALYETLIVTKYVESKALMWLSILLAVFVPFVAPVMAFFPAAYSHVSTAVVSAVFIYILIVFITMLASKEKFSLEHLSFVFLMTIIIPCFFSTIVFSNALSGGVFNILVIFMCAWGSDTGGYLFGGLYGRHQITPKISPKKTAEGMIGSVFSSFSAVIFTAYICDILVDTISVNYFVAFICGIIGSVLAILGDLFASVIKRSFGVKDFGSIIPGHGGIMDRFDSILFVAPFIYIVLSIAPIFPEV